MRLRVLSDLHLEHFRQGRELPEVAADAVILAGDIGVGLAGLGWAARRFAGTPVLYVPGNHEFYQQRMTALRAAMRQRAAQLGIHLLDNDSVELQGVRFLGTTLWTDFALYGSRAPQSREDIPPGSTPFETNPLETIPLETIPLETVSAALRMMPDYSLIEQPDGEVFAPEESVRLHCEAVAWLAEELARPCPGPRVVITHHAPLPDCIPLRYRGDVLSPAFASNLESLMGSAALWVHGHVHDAVDLSVHGTRVLCNPGGYPDEVPEIAPCLELVVEV
ncbi:metallophosphoesterase family protein [Halomonas cupida]|uniref:metallophosphoesterase family protein n=1 Tax=Halomonas cupida TaxID=44933 RepID=UPI003A90BA55